MTHIDLNKRGMGMVVLMIVLVIIALMAYFAWKKTPQKVDETNKSFTREAGIDTSSYKGMLESTKSVLNNATAARERELR